VNKTKIEWVKNPDGSQGYTINPVKGLCPVACSYCYARAMYKRFKWNPEIRWEPECLLDLELIKKPSRIFIGSMMELFGDWVKKKWLQDIFYWWLPKYPQHTFIFLTKQPQELPKWSPFPRNCFVGVSATNAKMAEEAGFWLWEIKAKVKFVSFEPLLERIPLHFADYISDDVQGINWVIIGTQTRPSKPPKEIWVREITGAAVKAGVAVFHKDNLGNIFDAEFPKRQEMPKEKCDG